MTELSFPFLTIGIALPLAAVPLVLRADGPDDARRLAIGGVGASIAMFLLAAREVFAAGHSRLAEVAPGWFAADAFNVIPMIVFAALALATLLLAPRRDADARSLTGLLILASATQTAYAAAGLGVLLAGWWLTCLPFMLGLFTKRDSGVATPVGLLVTQIAGSLALTLAVGMMWMGHTDMEHIGRVPFVLLIVAVALRKGIFPAHSWMVRSFETGPLLPVALLFNGHLGALLIVRAESSHLEAAAQNALGFLSMAALFTALYASVIAIAEKKPRRVLALLCVSQGAFIMAGLGSANHEGVTGALVHWLVVATASTGLVCAYRALEVRDRAVADGEGYLGLAAKTPRLAVFFLVCGLALVGLPGTLGYCAEDLLYHGALESHPALGIALLLATALNAIHLMRLYTRLFLGQRAIQVPNIPDALPRERWALSACVVFLVFGGLVPSAIIGWRAPAAEMVATALGFVHGHGASAEHAAPEAHSSPAK